MTKAEAKVVLEIMRTADNGCYFCSAALAEKFCKMFPEHGELAQEVFKDNGMFINAG